MDMNDHGLISIHDERGWRRAYLAFITAACNFGCTTRCYVFEIARECETCERFYCGYLADI